MTDRAKDRLSEMADTLIEKASKRWIEDVGDGFSCNLDLLREEILFHLKAGYELGRADENNEAAGIAEKRCQCPHHISIAYEIRSRLSRTGEGKA